MPYWKTINKHRHDPNHLDKELPWTFKEIYDDLLSSNITTLMSTSNPSHSLSDPIVARGITKPITTNSSGSGKPSSMAIHKTKDGRRFLMYSKQQPKSVYSRPSPCQLCYNKHVNPWHSTNQCPYKHPTYIIAKDVRERIMQHNALHGSENPNYTKTQDTPDAMKQPPQATGHSAITSIENNTIQSDNIISSNPDESSDLPVSFEEIDPDMEIIDTEHFDLPLTQATANKACIKPSESTNYSDLSGDEFITDHLQYLAYNS
jgi:hypothetical protein